MHACRSTLEDPTGIELVADFASGDRIALDNDVFTGLGAAGALGGASFAAGAGLASANTAAQRLLYDTTGGALYYDPDGNGAAVATQIALIGATTHAVLGAADFLVID